MQIIKDEELGPLIQADLNDFLSLCAATVQLPPGEIPRHMVGRMLLEASKCEELLDAFGASRNEYWSPVRMAMAMAKAFSRVIYNLHHISHSLKGYRLLDVAGDFPEETQQTLDHLLKAYIKASGSFIKLAGKMNLNRSIRPYEKYRFRDTAIDVKLKADRKRKKVENPRETALSIATHLLNLAEECTWLGSCSRTEPQNYSQCIPHLISEAKLRYLANDFHSLQSRYDTYLTGSEITEQDEKLPVMRGQITVVFHLLDTAVTLVHFYERHAVKNWPGRLSQPMQKKELLNIIIDYFISYADKYITAVQELCRRILKSYAVQGSIEVPIPGYRGFHVRPSTLLAKIITHYGSNVEMAFGSSVYNASTPIDMFRVNEEINRRKRESVAAYIMEHKLVKNDANAVYEEILMKKIFRILLFDLIEKNKAIVYTNDLSLDDLKPSADEPLAEFINRCIALYMAKSKIDIISNDKVTFKGDKRVLHDIRILAENGYGEDKYGNNIVLPKTLSYLRAGEAAPGKSP